MLNFVAFALMVPKATPLITRYVGGCMCLQVLGLNKVIINYFVVKCYATLICSAGAKGTVRL